MLWYNLLTSAADSASNSSGDGAASPWPTYIMFGIIAAILIVFMVYNRRTQMKKQQETMDMLNAIQPGNKVKTIGGICGVVVEVCPDDNTFILETGSEASGKSYVKFDKQAVYQTDAVAKKEEMPVAEEPASEPFAEETAEPETQEVSEEPATEETSAE